MHAPIDTKPRWERRKDARPQELLAAALDLFVERGQILFDDQMQRRRAARAMAEGQPLQHALVEMGANALLRQPAEADLIHHRINGGINGGEGPCIATRLTVMVALGNADQRPGAQKLIVERPWMTK